MKNIPCENCGYDPSKQPAWTWELTLDFEYKSGNAIPPNASGRTGYKYRNYRRGFERALRNALELGPIRAAKSYRRVILTRLWGKNQCAFDSDNLVAGGKPLRDVLTRTGLIVDDRPTCCDIYYRQHKRLESKTPGIHIYVEEF